jgi:hypothetical protein
MFTALRKKSAETHSGASRTVQRKSKSGNGTGGGHNRDSSNSGPAVSLGRIQRQVAVGEADNAHEKEADVAAERVNAGEPAGDITPVGPQSGAPPSPAGDEAASLADTSGPLQRQAEETAPAPAATNGKETATAEPDTAGGAPISAPVREQMESGFSADLSGVRVHNDSKAESKSAELNARAFTYGNHIFFNKGEYNPGTPQGNQLIAHEVAHTVQQGAVDSPHAKSGDPQKKAQTKPMVQRSWLGDAWDSVSGAVSSAVEWVADSVDAAIDYIKDRAVEFLQAIPGFTLLTVILGRNPITGAGVDRSGRNFIEAGLDVIPGGRHLKQKLEEEGALSEAAQWLDTQIAELDVDPAAIGAELRRFWNNIEISDVTRIRQKLSELSGIFMRPVRSIIRFARNIAVKLLQIVKDYVVSSLIDFIRERTTAYPLLTVILGEDPISGEQVDRTPIALLRGFMQLSESGAEQLRQMEESGSLQRAADWLDGAIERLDLSLDSIRGMFERAWDLVSIENLLRPIATFRELYDIFAGPVGRIIRFVVEIAVQVLRFIKDALINRLVAYARTVRGYPLLTVLLGRDPFSGEEVERSVANIVRGFMSLMENGEQQYQEMEQTGAIARLTERVENAVATLNFTWESIRGLFTTAWESFSLADLAAPFEAFRRLLGIFGEPLMRLIRFVATIVRLVIEVVMEVMNFPIDTIRNIITRAMEAIENIKRDPIGFLMNLLRAVKQGFSQFFDNILTHLLNGLTGWLFSELEEAGIQPPSDFSFSAILDFVLDVLGITAERIWQKLAERIGQERVDRIRRMIDRLTGIWTFVSDVMTRGPVAIWEYVQERLSNLWNVVLDAVKNWVITRIVQRVTARLLSMLDPTGIMAVVNGFIAFYSAVQSFIRYLREMLEIVNSFVEGVAEIAAGTVTRAANFLEGALAQAMPVAIGFLANQVGLSGLGRRIGEMVERVREMVDRALTWLIDRAVTAGTAFLNTVQSALGIGGGAAEGDGVPGEWWRKTRTITVGPNTHTISFSGTGANAALRISSGTEMGYQAWLTDAAESLSTDQQRQAHQQATRAANQIAQMTGGSPESVNEGRLDSALDDLLSAVQRTKLGNDPASRIAAATAEVEQKMASTSDTVALETHFAQIRDTYNLTNITFENLGEANAGVLIDINPRHLAPINDSKALRVEEGGRIRNTDWEIVPQVDFTTQTVQIGNVSDTAGRKMTAHRLGAGHAPGAEASTSSVHRDTLMAKLPTGGQASGAENKYIRGHLLNANVGGPASAENLFPITDQANRDHKNWVEAYVKEEVATGYVGKYEVTATKGQARRIGRGPLYSIDATFRCEYQRLNAKFNPIGSKVTITISSTYGGSEEEIDHEAAWGDLYERSTTATPVVSDEYSRSDSESFGQISHTERRG